MKKYFKYLPLLLRIILLATLFLIGFVSVAYPLFPIEKGAVQEITHVKYDTDAGDSGALELPAILEKLAPRTGVTLTAEFEVAPKNTLLVKSVFAPMKVFVNGKLASEYGQPDSYPAFMNDPPTALMFVSLPSEGGTISLRIFYQSLTQRSSLVLPAVFAGTTGALLGRQFAREGFSITFSGMLILGGLTTVLVTLGFVRKIPASSAFLRLGLASILTGMWVFGECDLTVLLFPYPVQLYAMTYLGLFLVVFSILHFGLLVVQPKNSRPILCLMWVHGVSVVAAIAMQLLGIMDFTKSLYWFHFIHALSFFFFVAFLFWEWRRNNNLTARRFLPSILIVTFFSILGLLNYWLRFTDSLVFFFQIGTIGFLLTLGFISGYYVQDALDIFAEKKRLEHQMQEVNRNLEIQRMQYHRIAENDAMIKAQRHDLRHQLTVLKVLFEQRDGDKFERYLEVLGKKLPTGREPILCDNYAVNAVVSHYAETARQAGAEVSVSLSIPSQLTTEQESDLCIIIGNLMENAAEACARMSGDERFVRVNSLLQHGVLTIAVDNSFEGNLQKKEGVFLSSKRKGEGVGLTSVSAVAKKYGGRAQFEQEDSVFQASVYLRIA